MPPKIKTSKEEVVCAAFEVARRDGLSAITAQSVSKQLRTSVAPIFRVFQTVEDVKAAVVDYIEQYHISYLMHFSKGRSKFISYGLAYISFAKEEPELFDALINSNLLALNTVEKVVSHKLDFVVESAASILHLEKEAAKELFSQIWIYTHGIACLVSKKSIELTEDEITQLLITAFESFKKTLPQGENE